MAYDLEERTARFAEEVVDLCKRISKTTVTIPIITQLFRSGTSMGANYAEANGASSRKYFHKFIFVRRKLLKQNIG